MGKLSKEELARFEGAAWALRMVEEKGLEAAQKDLEQRGIRRLPLACKKQDIREFEQYEKKNTLATVLMMTCMTLRDEYGFGFDRMNRFIRRFNTKTECLVDGYVNWKDLQLATRISELKDRGYMFKKERIKTKNRYGDSTHFDKYILIGGVCK